MYFFRFFSFIDYYKILCMVPCVTVSSCCLPILYLVVGILIPTLYHFRNDSALFT